jgi:LSD1 subclass zinc finger protein
MTVLNEAGERFLVESLFGNMDQDEFENVAYVEFDHEWEAPIPKQYIDMEGHVVCGHCRTLLDIPSWEDGADAYICENCGVEMVADDTS